jgi:long-chain acyl-CoA synthetase
MAPRPYESLVDMLEYCAKTFAEHPLFGTKVNGQYQWITYREFNDQVAAMRVALTELGVTRGQKVAAISNNRVEWAVMAYATYTLGAHYVPMYEAQLPKEWKYIVEDSGSAVLCCATQAIYDRTADIQATSATLRARICFDAPASELHSYQHHLRLGAAKRSTASVAPVFVDASETAGLIYTSGTTGEPKGVILSHGNIVSNLNAVNESIPLMENDRSCSFLPWAHSFGQTAELHAMMSRGAAIGIAESVNTLLDDFLLVKPTVLFSVPRVFNRIYDGLQKRMATEKPIKRLMFYKGLEVSKARRLLAATGKRSTWLDFQHRIFDRLVFTKVRARFGGEMKYAFSGGAALAQEVAEFIDDVGIVVFEGYGLTETSPIATCNRPDKRRFGTIGVPIPGVEIYICDEDGRVLPKNTPGEIIVVGPNVMQGYHNRTKETEDVIFDLMGKRAFRTGDMGRIDDDGFVKIVGRFKEQYKLENGKYVVPTPLEDQIRLSGFINQAFIYGDNRLHNVVLVVPDFEALRKWAAENGVAAADNNALAAHPKVRELLGREIETYSREFKQFEVPKNFAVLTEEFTTENDLLTPKMSVKRRNVVERYKAVIDGLY